LAVAGNASSSVQYFDPTGVSGSGAGEAAGRVVPGPGFWLASHHRMKSSTSRLRIAGALSTFARRARTPRPPPGGAGGLACPDDASGLGK
jgi:hypothetical protein